jgi:hypothetical protein
VTFPAAATYAVRARVSAGYGGTAFTLDTGAGSVTVPVARTPGWGATSPSRARSRSPARAAERW